MLISVRDRLIKYICKHIHLYLMQYSSNRALIYYVDTCSGYIFCWKHFVGFHSNDCEQVRCLFCVQNLNLCIFHSKLATKDFFLKRQQPRKYIISNINMAAKIMRRFTQLLSYIPVVVFLGSQHLF